MTRVMEISETQVSQRLARSRIIALAAVDDVAQVEVIGETLLRAGVTSLELSTSNVGLLRAARRIEGLLVGAGHVHSAEQAEAAVRGGAHFATAAATNMEVVHACRELELPFFPGVATPSEIERLALLGIRTLRVFPAELLGGPAFLRTMAAIYPDVQFIPSGGIGPESLRGYLNLPSVLAVAGSGLIRPDLMRSGNFERIEWLLSEAMRAGQPSLRLRH
jgi:2-dehydro-3-deoxyphosphogluconate aldolase/(4S)-4-hydroxy-2-oxoglutarate aldolase